MTEIPPPPLPQRKPRGAGSCLIVVAVLLVLMLAPVVLFWLFVRSLEGRPVTVRSGTVLELDLAGVVGEGPTAVDLGALFGRPALSLFELSRAIDAAADDDDVVAIRLLLRGTGLGWASAEEVLARLDAFRATGKPIYALLEGDLVDDLTYFLATAADQVWIAPATAAAVNGLAIEAQFYRGTFDKLHVEPQVLMLGDYKSAGEPLLNHEMSPYMRESLEAVLDTTADRFLERVSERRDLATAEVEAALARTVMTAPELVEAGLADEIGYLDQVDAALVEATGADEYRGLGIGGYRRDPRPSHATGSERIALVFGEGPVLTEAPPGPLPFLETQVLSGSRVAAHIREAAESEEVRAIVFRINSPGGSAVGSDIVWRAIEEARAAGKPVVVSMSDVAGSGGYWVAMGADAIVAHPTTLTGSIGVVFTKLNLDGFFEWLGTHVDRVVTAPGADALGSGPLDPEERARILAWMEHVYGLFTDQVAAGRSLAPDRVREIARGRVWSGRDALDIGLVDRLGGLPDAFALAKEKAGLDPDREYALDIYPRTQTLFEVLFADGASRVMALARRGAIEEWMRQVAAPQVLARGPDLRIR